jgi:signal transduction histidine kinase
VVSSLVFFLGNQKQNKVVQFVTDLQQDIPLFNFDPEQVENVLLNLGINGIQSIENQGTITFRTSYNPADQFVNIQVEDDGIGIPVDKKDDVFSPFFTTRTEGTGLGLAIAKEIVEKHNGSIHFYANEGKGTTFEVKLPV